MDETLTLLIGVTCGYIGGILAEKRFQRKKKQKTVKQSGYDLLEKYEI